MCVIITKVDNLDENEVAQIKDAVGEAGKRSRINGVEVFTYSTNSDLGDEYVQKSEINSWAHHNLDDYLRESFIPSLKKAQGQMAEMMIKHKIPKYAALAAGIVTATSFVPVPLSDSVPLMGIQVKMAMDILSCYGIDNDMKGAVKNLAGAGFVSYIENAGFSAAFGDPICRRRGESHGKCFSGNYCYGYPRRCDNEDLRGIH